MKLSPPAWKPAVIAINNRPLGLKSWRTAASRSRRAQTLLDRKLIAVAGRKNVIGKPILYKTTKEFLIQFGLKDLSELPSLKEFEEIRRMAFSDGEAPVPEADSAVSEPLSETVAEPDAAEPAVEAPASAPEAPCETAGEHDPKEEN